MAGDKQFHIVDYVVFAITIVISIAIGIYHARKRRLISTNDYLVGSRSMKSFPLALSMVVSFESAILVLGLPAEVYTHGFIFFWVSVSIAASYFIIYRVVPRVIYPLKITTIYEYLDLCFKSKAVRILASILALIHQVIYMGVVLFGPSIALQAVVGFPLEWSIIILAGASILYTSIRVNTTSTIWTCSVRSTKIRCHASVSQHGDQFRAGVQNHNHAADLKLPLYKEIASKVKQKLTDQPQSLAMEVVTTVLTEDIPADLRFLAPKQKQLKRTANKHRATTRPSEPTDLDFVGGFRAVIWTDVFQGSIMMLSFIVVLIKGTIDAGGPAEIYEHNLKGERLEIFEFDFNPAVRHTTWCLLFGGIIKGLGIGLSQATIQRVSSAADQKTAERAVLMCVPLYFITSLIPLVHGLIIYSYYSKVRCDPLANKEITNPNQILVLFVLDVFNSLPGLAGLFIAALYSACLSTLSSGFSVASAVIVDDYASVLKPNLSDRTKTNIGRIVVLIFGLVSIGVAFLVSNVRGPLTQIVFSLIASCVGPLTGLTLLALLVPFANAKGAIVGVISGVLMTSWITFGSLSSSTLIKTPSLPPTYTDQCINDNSTSPYNYTMAALDKIRIYENYEPQGLDKLYSLSYFWFDTVGLFTVLIVGSVVSVVTGSNKLEDVDSQLKYPVLDELCCCLPKSIRRHLGCGVKYQKEEKNGINHVDDKVSENNEKEPFQIKQEEMEMNNYSRQPPTV